MAPDKGFLLHIHYLARPLLQTGKSGLIKRVRPRVRLYFLGCLNRCERTVAEIVIVPTGHRHSPAHAEFINQPVIALVDAQIPGEAFFGWCVGIYRQLRASCPSVNDSGDKQRDYWTLIIIDD